MLRNLLPVKRLGADAQHLSAAYGEGILLRPRGGSWHVSDGPQPTLAAARHMAEPQADACPRAPERGQVALRDRDVHLLLGQAATWSSNRCILPQLQSSVNRIKASVKNRGRGCSARSFLVNQVALVAACSGATPH